MEVAYNNVFKRLYGYDRFYSANKMFVENRVENFETNTDETIDLWVTWKPKCLKKQSNRLLNEQCCMVKFWITTKVGKNIYMQSWINT